MSKIAQLITGLTSEELINQEVPSIWSASQVFYPKGVQVRQSVRASAKLIMGPADLDARRQRLLKSLAPVIRKAM
jgi:hypothetical protein